MEVFNAGGAGTDAPFQYHLWEKAGGTDVYASVTFAGLSHMLWWDNRGGSPTPVGTCLFLGGPATAELSPSPRAWRSQRC